MNQTDPTSFRDLLSHDHARLDVMLGSVLELTRLNLQPNLDEYWALYEENLLTHLDAEEMFLLPGLANNDPALAGRIREEHAQIRTLMAEIGVGLQLHVVREEQMLALARFLRAHAKLEELPLYIWADTAAPEGTFALVLRRLRATWQRIRSSVNPPGKKEATNPTLSPVVVSYRESIRNQ